MSIDGKKVQLYAPAKINLCLRVSGRRPDGYHDIETWMQKIDLCDTILLEITGRTGIEFFCDDPLLSGMDNLAVKAAEIFFSALGTGRLPKLKIRLEKEIPVAAGLGGGSSDAGAVLKGLNRLYNHPFSENELIELARPLGADVPFFAAECNAVIAYGTGDIMCSVDSLEDYTFVLVNPGFFVSTRWVFENLSLTSVGKKYTFPGFHKCTSDLLSLSVMHNDLEKVTSARFSEIEDMKKRLLELGALKVLMSGSGATVFGMFPDTGNPSRPDFSRIVSELSRKFGDKVFVARASAGAWPSG